MNFSEESEEIEYGFPIVAGDTEKGLAELHARAETDYRDWKRGFLDWLTTEGKKPDRLEGFADETVKKTSYHIGQIMRWLWDKRGYTTELSPEDADEFMKKLGRYSDYADSNLNNFIKAIKRLFKYYNHEKGKSIDWECNFSTSEPKVTNRDYFIKKEFRPLYEAALNHGAIKHYHSMTIEERDRMKGMLATRFDKKKENVALTDFERANSFKVPSLVATSLDMGLRPIEVQRATTEWIDLNEEVVRIPAEESSKNRDNWECVLSDNSVRCLEKWLNERETYDDYQYTNTLWLNDKGTEYRSKSLNYLLDSLIEESEIQPAGRDLTWYSIRHGVATVWADEENIQDAREQLRHKRVKTTMSYAHSSTSNRRGAANTKY